MEVHINWRVVTDIDKERKRKKWTCFPVSKCIGVVLLRVIVQVLQALLDNSQSRT